VNKQNLLSSYQKTELKKEKKKEVSTRSSTVVISYLKIEEK
jgi:hypothetical protein